MKRGVLMADGLGVAVLIIADAGAQIWLKQVRAKAGEVAPAALPDVKAVLIAPPLVPPLVDRPGNAKVIVHLETIEMKGTLADGPQYTFSGSSAAPCRDRSSGSG